MKRPAPTAVLALLVQAACIANAETPGPATTRAAAPQAQEPYYAFYGGQSWLIPDDPADVPATAYSTAGNRSQYLVVVPTHDLVIVRRGLGYRRQGFDRWGLTREVLKAVAPVAEE